MERKRTLSKNPRSKPTNNDLAYAGTENPVELRDLSVCLIGCIERY
jgi:hypothetical protein